MCSRNFSESSGSIYYAFPSFITITKMWSSHIVLFYITNIDSRDGLNVALHCQCKN